MEADPIQQAADWMFEQIQTKRYLEQESTAYTLKRKFGKECTYINDNGNVAIAKPVLSAFRKLTGAEYVWSNGEKAWRKRTKTDKPTRSQD